METATRVRRISKVTRKGQITIPVEFRERHRITEGSSVTITDFEGKLVVEPVPDALDLLGVDHGKYETSKLKKMLDQSRKSWR